MNNKPGNYDDIKFESSEHSGIFINDVSKTVSLRLKGKAIITLSGGSCQINPPLAMRYVEGLVGKIQEIENRITKCEQNISTNASNISSNTSRIESLERRWY